MSETANSPATFRHFAINADDVGRAKQFYEAALGWRFTPFGPPDFYQVRNAGNGVLGALQERRELVPGRRIVTFENTFGVVDLAATMRAVAAGGGRAATPSYRIEGVGDLQFAEDTEGNAFGVMQYDPGVWE